MMSSNPHMTGLQGRGILMNRYARGLLAAGLVGGIVACGPAQADGTEDAEATGAFVRVINVEVAPISTGIFLEEIRLTSVALANRDVMLEAEESGAIVALYVDRGDAVSAGDWIAKIDDRILKAQVDQSRAAAELAQQTWERRKRLWEEDQVGSEIAYLEAKFAAEQTAAALVGLEQRLDNTVIKAPFSGVFDERYVDIGANVSPGEAIGRIVDLDPIKIVAGVPERYAADVRVGTTAELLFEALGGKRYEAPVRYVSATVDPQNRTFGIELEVENRDRAIKPQMVANLSVVRQRLDDVIVVPQDALVRVEDGYVVFVLGERDGYQVAEAREVEVGPSRRNLVVVRAGVSEGERLIVVGHRSVADGDRVNVVGG
ncbi:MAG: efflux RND transporter periplasmic adaptor subunit [Gemmatimonadota bacterium]|nr:efflux RND transporter periplasmic adaptor subunit [Gemmatimonadota bacterium]